jgi:hypothetical protein
VSFAFDTLDYVRRLRAGGVPNEQAEAMAQALAATFSSPMGVATEADIATLRIELKADIAALENRLIIKLGAFIIAVAGLTLAIARMLP